MRKKIYLFLMSILMFSLVGCKKEEVPQEPIYELTSYSYDQLQKNHYYIKSGEEYFPLAKGTLYYDNGSIIPQQVDNNRVLFFGKDEVYIPTMYEEDSIVYITDEAVPNTFIWERFEDLGYTVGIRNIEQTDSGKITFKKIDANIFSMSQAANAFSQISNDTTISVDKCNSQNIDATMLSKSNTLSNCVKDETYSLDTYIGTNYQKIDLIADTHAFTSFELYDSTEYSLSSEGYAVIAIPTYFRSGYYYLNGMGLFKYVSASRTDDISNINYNSAYYLGYNDEGVLITADDVATSDETIGEDVNDTTTTYEPIWHNKMYVDCAQQKMSITIEYSKLADLVNGQVIELQETASTVTPTAIIISPDNKEYTFSNNTEQENSLVCSIDAPLSGEWDIQMKGMNNRTFTVRTEYDSGHSDSLVHSGNNKASMSLYIDKTMIEGIFSITWENTSRAADVTIKTPKNEEFGKSINPNSVVSEGYGYIDLNLGNCVTGDYIITISGEDLGRVRCVYKDNYIPNNQQEPETNSTEEETSNPIFIPGTI